MFSHIVTILTYFRMIVSILVTRVQLIQNSPYSYGLLKIVKEKFSFYFLEHLTSERWN